MARTRHSLVEAASAQMVCHLLALTGVAPETQAAGIEHNCEAPIVPQEDNFEKPLNRKTPTPGSGPVSSNLPKVSGLLKVARLLKVTGFLQVTIPVRSGPGP